MFTKALVATLITGTALVSACTASPQNSPVQQPVVQQVFDEQTNVPGKSLVSVRVNYPPGTKSVAHHHAKSAFIMAYVISGAIRSQVEGQPERIFHAGQTWKEDPGAHHVVSENASATEPAELLAVFLVDTGDKVLTVEDASSGH